jgi:adenine-specific DNA-methyltransferase
MAKKPSTPKAAETLKHDEDKRKNIPPAEFQSVLEKEQQTPKTVRYPRNTDLDPQLVWRGGSDSSFRS